MRLAPRGLLALFLTSALIVPAWGQIAPADPLVVIEADSIPGDFTAAMEEAAEGRALFIAGNHAEALEMLRPLADAGNPVAQNILGIALTDLNGAYGPYDAAEGFRYLLAAGAQNFGPAMHNLGDSYEEEHDGIAPDPEQAFRWYLAAAELGYVRAYYNVGYGLVNGYGVAQDLAAGRVWLDRALDGDERAEALTLLGDLAYYGEGQEADLAQALALYLEAAGLGHAEAAYYAGYQYYWGEGTDQDWTAAAPFLEQALAGGERAGALNLLGNMAYHGEGREVDFAEAFAFYLEAAGLGDADAAFRAAYQYLHGEGTEVDEAAALPLLEQAVAGDVPEAFSFLAELHAEAVVPGTDPSRALALAMHGDDLGDGYAAIVLGRFHRHGVEGHVPVDPDAARSAYLRGVERGQAGALRSLGLMAYHGEGEPVDHARAYDYFRQAVEMAPDYGAALYALSYMEMRGEGTPRDLAAATAHIEAALAVGEDSALVAGVILFGSPTHAGPQSDPVRAFAHCIASEAVDWLEGQDPGDLGQHFATCERLSAELSAEDQTRAAELAAPMVADLPTR